MIIDVSKVTLGQINLVRVMFGQVTLGQVTMGQSCLGIFILGQTIIEQFTLKQSTISQLHGTVHFVAAYLGTDQVKAISFLTGVFVLINFW